MIDKLTDILNDINVIILQLDKRANVIYANAQAEKFFGKTTGEIQGSPFFNVLPIKAKERNSEFYDYFYGISSPGKAYFRVLYERAEGLTGCIEWHVRKMYKNDELQSYILTGNDITAFMILEDFIAGSRNRLSYFLKTVPMGIIEIDLTGKIIMSNLAFNKMLGYDDFELIGKSFHLLLDENNRHKIRELLKEMDDDSDVYSCYYRILKKDKSMLPVQIEFSKKSDENNRTIGYSAFITDLTISLSAEKEIIFKEEKFQAVFKTSHDAVLIYQMDGKILEANYEAGMKFGYDFEELLKRSIYQLTDLQEKFDAHELHKEILHKGVIEKEFSLKTFEQKNVPVNARFCIINRNGDNVFLVALKTLC